MPATHPDRLDPVHADGLGDDELRAAYERGRRDERRGRKRHPILMTLMVVVAVLGVVLLALAAKEGSFARSGQVVDDSLNVAAERAQPAAREAAADAGQSLREVGQNIRAAAPADPANAEPADSQPAPQPGAGG
jgi:hypothetical protein